MSERRPIPGMDLLSGDFTVLAFCGCRMRRLEPQALAVKYEPCAMHDAAPELLKACRAALSLVEELEDPKSHQADYVKRYGWGDRLRAVIAKATGEPMPAEGEKRG